jgi:hypothetical protein
MLTNKKYKLLFLFFLISSALIIHSSKNDIRYLQTCASSSVVSGCNVYQYQDASDSNCYDCSTVGNCSKCTASQNCFECCSGYYLYYDAINLSFSCLVSCPTGTTQNSNNVCQMNINLNSLSNNQLYIPTYLNSSRPWKFFTYIPTTLTNILTVNEIPTNTHITLESDQSYYYFKGDFTSLPTSDYSEFKINICYNISSTSTCDNTTYDVQFHGYLIFNSLPYIFTEANKVFKITTGVKNYFPLSFFDYDRFNGLVPGTTTWSQLLGSDILLQIISVNSSGVKTVLAESGSSSGAMYFQENIFIIDGTQTLPSNLNGMQGYLFIQDKKFVGKAPPDNYFFSKL